MLEDQAAGHVPDKAQVLSGALALDTLKQQGQADRDILDAAAGLEALAKGMTIDLDASGRARAAYLAEVIREAAAPPR